MLLYKIRLNIFLIFRYELNMSWVTFYPLYTVEILYIHCALWVNLRPEQTFSKMLNFGTVYVVVYILN